MIERGLENQSQVDVVMKIEISKRHRFTDLKSKSAVQRQEVASAVRQAPEQLPYPLSCNVLPKTTMLVR